MTEGNCKARFVTAALKFKATVHIEGEKAYEVLINELKDISLEFVDDLEGANVPTVLRFHQEERRSPLPARPDSPARAAKVRSLLSAG